jgi:hypothetical protein
MLTSVIKNKNMYLSDNSNNIIHKINLKELNVRNIKNDAIYGPTFLAMYNNCIYVSNLSNSNNSTSNFISTIDLSGNIIEEEVVNFGILQNFVIGIYKGYIYVLVEDTNSITNFIKRVKLSDSTLDQNFNVPITLLIMNGLNLPQNQFNILDFVIYNNTIYLLIFSSLPNSVVVKLNLDNIDNIDNIPLYSTTNFIYEIFLYNNRLYLLEIFPDEEYKTQLIYLNLPLDQTVHLLATPALLPVLPPVLPLVPIPFSNTCFPANTPIVTDQGIIKISKIDPKKHTINKKKIIDITKTKTMNTFLICFEKNALGVNVPNKKTVMTKQHKILYKGILREAQWFVDKSNRVYKIPYKGEILYNVLLDSYSIISVNNLLCETLHPNNIIAKLYSEKEKYTDKVKERVLSVLKKTMESKQFHMYHEIMK